jgi:paraquat-inducible protein B
MTVDARGVRLDTQSLVTLLIGGIAFDTVDGTLSQPAAEEGMVFQLYPDFASTRQRVYAEKHRWLVYFDESIAGLDVDAPVEFRGIQIGKVLDIRLEYDDKNNRFLIPVLIETEPDRIVGGNQANLSEEERRGRLDQLVKNGLRAQLDTGSLLTGKRLVTLKFDPQAPPASMEWKTPYPVLPTIPAPLAQVETSITGILAKLEKLPLEQIGNDLRDTVRGTKQITTAPELREALENFNVALKEARQLVSDMRANVAPELSNTLVQAQKSLASAEKAIGTDSPLQANLSNVMRELVRTTQALRELADYLERHPEALLKGKGGPQ